jgi:hypothetical protein
MTKKPLAKAERLALGSASEYLKNQHDKGDELAVFDMARVVCDLDIPDDHIPPWVAAFFVRSAGEYMKEYTAARRGGSEIPSLDKKMGLGRQKSTRWTRERRKHTKRLFQYLYCSTVKRAKLGQRAPYVGRSGKPVPILDKQGRATQDFQIELLYSVGLGPGQSREADYRMARRLLKGAC